MGKRIPPRPAQTKGDDVGPRVREEPPRLLDKNPGMARQDYTDQVHRAAKDEPEAISEETTTQYARENRARFEATRTREIRRRDHMTLQAHLREFCMLAARLDLDPLELTEIRQAVDRGRQRLLAQPAWAIMTRELAG